MFIFDVTNILTLFLLLVATVLLIFLSQELKKSWISALPLASFLLLLVVHAIQMITLSSEYSYLFSKLSVCLIVDLLFIAMTFLAFLWVDDLEAEAMNKKSIDNSLDWFWKKL